MDKLTPQMEAAILRLVADAMDIRMVDGYSPDVVRRPYSEVAMMMREEAARREGEALGCRWCEKLAGCTGACGKRDSAATPPAADAPDELVRWLRQCAANSSAFKAEINAAAIVIEADARKIASYERRHKLAMDGLYVAFEERDAAQKRVAELEDAIKGARMRIGARIDNMTEAQREAAINSAWHLLDTALAGAANG